MTPRLPTSIKWTELPPELCGKIREVFAQQFPNDVEVGEFIVEGRIFPKEIMVRIGYLRKGRLRQHNIEASVEYSPETLAKAKKTTMDPLYLAVDAIGSVLPELLSGQALGDDVLETEVLDLPRDWTAFELDGEDVYLRYSTVNSGLEAEADRLLGDFSADLVQGRDDESDLH